MSTRQVLDICSKLGKYPSSLCWLSMWVSFTLCVFLLKFGLPFLQKRFLEMLRVLDLNPLSSNLAISLVLPSWSSVYTSACLLALECVISFLISLWGLKPAFLLVSWRAVAMLWEFLIGTPQTGRLLNGAFGPSQNSIRHSLDVCHTEIASHRHFQGGFVKTSATVAISDSAIRTELDRLIRPSLLPQSGTVLNMQHRWQTPGCKLLCNVVDEDKGDTPALWLSMVLHVSEVWREASASTASLTQWSVPLWFCEPQVPRWASEACSHATKKSVTKNEGRKIRHHGFTRRKNNKCRNPSHACTPRRNPSPPLRPVTAAFAHLLTDQHPIWSVLKVIYVSCNYGFITCLAQTLVLLEICLLPAQDACRNITICTLTQKNRGFSFFATTFVVRQMQLHRAELLFFRGIASLQRQDCPSDGQPMNLQEPWKMCKACPNLFFLWGPSAPFSKRPVCGDPTLDTAKKNSQPDLIPISKAGTSAELGVGSRLVWVWASFRLSCKRPTWEWCFFFGGFLRWIVGRKIQQKIRQNNPPENPPPENKKTAGTQPPSKTTAEPKTSAAKSTK